MSRTTLIRLAIALVVVLVAWGGLALAHGPVSDRAAVLALPHVDTAAVDTVTLVKANDTVRLARAAHGAWLANGYPAAPEAMATLLHALADTARWTEQVAEGRALHASMGVSSDSGQRLRVVTHGHALLDLITGKRTPDGTGVYVRLASADPVYALHGTLATAIDRTPDSWRDERIASIRSDSIRSIEVRRPHGAYTLRRVGTRWQLASGGVLDSLAVKGLLAQYENLSASGFATRAQADSAHFGATAVHVTLAGSATRPLLALGFDSTAAAVWARPDTGGVVFRLGTWQLRDLAPAKSQLLAKPAPHTEHASRH